MSGQRQSPHSKTVTIRPADLIPGPYIKCPYCGEREFGITSVNDSSYSRRCRACLRPNQYDGPYIKRLPAITKKVIYLDQFAISKLRLAVHPDSGVKGRRVTAQGFGDLFALLSELHNYQVIVCPSSEAHVDESLAAKSPDSLQTIYNHFAGKCRFQSFDYIRTGQLMQFVEAWARGESYDPEKALTIDAISGRPNAWSPRIYPLIKLSKLLEFRGEIVESKHALSSAIEQIFGRWRTERGRKFADWYDEEVKAFGSAMLQSCTSIQSFYWFVGIAMRVEKILGLEEGEGGLRVTECLSTADLSGIPSVNIQALMWAALARKAAAGQVRPPSPGMSKDISIIAHLLPYCDAMLLDNECWALLNEEPLKSKLSNYNTTLFSTNLLDRFQAYLRQLQEEISPAHARMVRRVYGKPGAFWSILRNDQSDP